MNMERLFYNTLENIFVGSEIRGEGGFVNLLAIKRDYYVNVIDQFKREVNNNKIITKEFKEEFFDKLYNFFKNYFNESGSVYFVKEDIKNNMSEKLYANNKDVTLFWKTSNLYYVKSDIIFQNADIEIEDSESKKIIFHFNVGNLKGKQNNTKKQIIYNLKKCEDIDEVLNVYLDVSYSERNKITDFDSLSRETNVEKECILKSIFLFEKQDTVDFFINKNAENFLIEQLNNYINEILINDENEFVQERLEQIKCIKKFAIKLIKFISQFEKELARIWNKPKFAKNSLYIMSLKTLKERLNKDDYNYYLKLSEKLYELNKSYKEDIDKVIMSNYCYPLEKKYVYNIEKTNNKLKLFYLQDLSNKTKKENAINNGVEKLDIQEVFDKNKYTSVEFPIKIEDREIEFEDVSFIDTSFLSKDETDELLRKLSKNNTLEDIIDGYIIKTDNYQFLNTSNKFTNKINLIYIDPPFNTDGNYAFIDGFKDSTWLTMMYDRLYLLKNKFLNYKTGSLYMHLDHHCNYYGRILLDDIFNEELEREIIWNTSPSVSGFKAKSNNFIRQHDTILYYKHKESDFNKMYRNYKNANVDGLGWLDIFHDEYGKQYVMKYKDNETTLSKEYLDKFDDNAIGDVWNDIYSMMYTQNMTRENWNISNTQKPENLLRRIIQSSSNQGDYVMDIYAGTGTTAATAHKLNRKWIVTEFGDYTESTVLMRMKTVISGDFRTKLSEDINWKGGGIFKYYELEQYEETLDNSLYEGQQSFLDKEIPSVYSQYIFFNDKKLIGNMKIDNNNKIDFDIKSIYENIDIIETISNITGLPFLFVDDKYYYLGDNKNNIKIRINYEDMSEDEKVELIKLIKPYLWWGD